ncbi:MAG: glycoside hydrolase family 9 protein [Hyphomicrobiaceae bacterium]
MMIGTISSALGTASTQKPLDSGTLSASSNSSTGHRYIMVDQFGYRPNDVKIAVLADPQIGYNASDEFSPARIYQVRRSSDDVVIFSARIVPYKKKKVQRSSGDRGYWFDFTSVREVGSFYLYDKKNKVRSHVFDIRNDVYRDVLKAAMRMFFYNRSGFAKSLPYADKRWTDAAASLGPNQDSAARDVNRKNDPSSTRDLRGGWFDAGDTNKYVNFAGVAMHALLAAYRESPDVWGDNYGIPESGNGIPDIIDELKWELDWIERMQEDDGGVLLKVGYLDYKVVAPPSADRRPRYYVPACSSSTIVAASIFAHAAIVFARIPAMKADAQNYQQRALRAWKWYRDNPKRDDCDNQEVKSGDSDKSLKDQRSDAVVAAIYLFSLTGRPEFEKFISENYGKMRPLRDIGWTRYDAHQGDALLFYASQPKTNPAVATKILKAKRLDATRDVSKRIYADGITMDLYRSYITPKSYTWGSNQVRANIGNSNFDLITYKLAGSKTPIYRERALGAVHYFHGVNPQGLVYLSNMADYGAEVSVSEMHHDWFRPGTKWHSSKNSSNGPAPGYLVGGPNAAYTGRLAPPARQPKQKSYRDWSGGWREKAWEVSEPSIVYQGAYVKLISKFVPPID